MKKVFSILFLSAAIVVAISACKDNAVSPATNNAAEEKAIQQLLDAYGVALNASDAAKVTTLYTQAGQFAAPGLPTAVGSSEIKSTYEGIFKTIGLNLQFTPAQIKVVNGDYAFATSTSSGPITVLANNQTTVNNYRELWVFAKENGQWKIARYYFNQP